MERKLTGKSIQNTALALILIQLIGIIFAIIFGLFAPTLKILSSICLFVVIGASIVLSYQVYNALGIIASYQQLTFEQLEKGQGQPSTQQFIQPQIDKINEQLSRQIEEQRHIYEELRSIRDAIYMRGPVPQSQASSRPAPQTSKRVIPGTVRCSKCGSLNPDYASFCEQCNENLTN